MSDRIFVPLADGRWLGLTPEAFQTALAEGSAIGAPTGAPIAADEPLLDAEELATAMKLPTTWLEQAAREGRIPSIQAGRWRRFRRSDVERALQKSEAPDGHHTARGSGQRAQVSSDGQSRTKQH